MSEADGLDQVLGGVIHDLYAGPLTTFASTRTAALAAYRASHTGGTAAASRALGGLRKPTVTGWACNQLVRRHPECLTELIAIGEELAQAHRRGDGATIRELGPRRRAALETALEQARAACDEVDPAQRLSPASLDGVRETLIAAMADPQIAQVVSQGCLVKGLHHVGLGTLDTDEAAPALVLLRGGSGASLMPTRETNAADEAPSGGSEASPTPTSERDSDRKRADAGRRRQALARSTAAAAAVGRAEAAAVTAQARVAGAQAALQAAQDALDTARTGHAAALAAAAGAQERLTRAQQALADAQADLSTWRPARSRAGDAERRRVSSPQGEGHPAPTWR